MVTNAWQQHDPEVPTRAHVLTPLSQAVIVSACVGMLAQKCQQIHPILKAWA